MQSSSQTQTTGEAVAMTVILPHPHDPVLTPVTVTPEVLDQLAHEFDTVSRELNLLTYEPKTEIAKPD